MKILGIIITAIVVCAAVGAVSAREATTIKELNAWAGKIVAPDDTFEGNVFARFVDKGYGYEVQFYKSGIAVIRVGQAYEVKGVTRVTATALQIQGKYTVVDENTVLIAGDLAGWFETNPTQIEYTLIRAYEDKDFPGVIHPTKIVSEYEKNAHRATQIPGPNEVWYPQLQHIDNGKPVAVKTTVTAAAPAPTEVPTAVTTVVPVKAIETIVEEKAPTVPTTKAPVGIITIIGAIVVMAVVVRGK